MSSACPNCCSNTTKKDGKFDNLVVCDHLANPGNTRVGILNVNRLEVGALFAENLLGTFEVFSEPLVAEIDPQFGVGSTFSGTVYRFGNVGFISFNFSTTSGPVTPGLRLGRITDSFFWPSATIYVPAIGGSGLSQVESVTVNTDGTIDLTTNLFGLPAVTIVGANQLYITN
jgi:hypothetical protein